MADYLQNVNDLFFLQYDCTETALRYIHIGYTLQRKYTENSKLILPEKKLRGHSPSSYTFMFLCAVCIFPRSICIFCCMKIGGPIVGIYKSLTDT